MADENNANGTPAPDTSAPAPSVTATAAAEAARVADAAADDAVLNQLEGVADAEEAAPAAKPEAKPEAKADPADDADPLADVKAPGVKGGAKAADPKAERRAIAAGQLALEEQGFTEEDIAGMSPERVAALGAKRLADQAAAEVEEVDTATTATAAPVAGLDEILKGLMLDEGDATKLKGVVAQAVQAQVADKLKGLEAAQAKAETATDAMLQMRFNTAMRPLLTEFPALKDKAKLAEFLAEMDALDHGQKIGLGADADAFNRLIRKAAFAVLGDGIAAATRRGTVTAAKRQAAAVAEAPVGGANPAAVGLSASDEEDRVLDAIAGGKLPTPKT